MSYRIKVPPKELPADEAHLLSGMERFLDHVQEHRQMIVLGLVVLLAAIVAVGVVVWLDLRNADAARELVRQGTQLYLDRPADNAAKADANLKQAITLFRQVVESYPRTPSAPLALFELGNALVQSNQLDEAITTYRKYISTYGSNKVLLGMVYQRLGYTYLLKGDRDQAAKAFSAVLDVPGSLNRDQAIFELGKLEEALSRPEGALARYQELMKDYPNSPFASEVAVRMKAMEVKKAPEGTPAPAQEGKPTAPASSKAEKKD